jgi:hypothetical protein
MPVIHLLERIYSIEGRFSGLSESIRWMRVLASSVIEVYLILYSSLSRLWTNSPSIKDASSSTKGLRLWKSSYKIMPNDQISALLL